MKILTIRLIVALCACLAITLVSPVAWAQDAAGLGVRLDRLDNQLRVLTGQIEQLQFQNKRLEEQLRKAQHDTDFRFQELGGKPGAAPPKRSDASETPRQPVAAVVAPPVVVPPLLASPTPVLPVTPRKPPRNVTGGDAFDPAAQPNAPGAPRPLGGPALPGPTAVLPATLPGGRLDAGLEEDPLNTPVELGQPHVAGNSGIEPLNPGGAPLLPPGQVPGAPVLAPLVPAGPLQAAIPGQPQLPQQAPLQAPLDDYQLALASLKQGQYEVAEKSLNSFILKNPRSHRVPDATYYLGETFFQRGRHSEAAEQFLKLSTSFSGSSRAPDGMLRLGMSLKALGAGEQACATFAEIAKKYPAAPIAVRKGAEREMVRNKC